MPSQGSKECPHPLVSRNERWLEPAVAAYRECVQSRSAPSGPPRVAGKMPPQLGLLRRARQSVRQILRGHRLPRRRGSDFADQLHATSRSPRAPLMAALPRAHLATTAPPHPRPSRSRLAPVSDARWWLSPHPVACASFPRRRASARAQRRRRLVWLQVVCSRRGRWQASVVWQVRTQSLPLLQCRAP